MHAPKIKYYIVIKPRNDKSLPVHDMINKCLSSLKVKEKFPAVKIFPSVVIHLFSIHI